MASCVVMRQTRSMRDGDRMLIPCAGGPTGWRAASFPPPLEVSVDHGVYVLVDDGPPEHWTYQYVPVGVER